MTSILAEALTWHAAGATPVPVATDGSKRPIGAWADWIDHHPDTTDVVTRFAHVDTDGIGLICGSTSGGLEMVEFEGRAIDAGLHEDAARVFADHDAADLWRRVWTGYREASPSGGVHLLLRVVGTPVRGNTRLARDEHGKVLVETRGQGGYVVVAPSAGRTHPAGPYVLLEGGPGTVPEVDPDEYDLLHGLLGMLDATPEVVTEPRPETRPRQPGDPLRPGDDYNARATWAEVIGPHGWTLVQQRGRLCTWRKPGKRGAGHSATSGRNEADNLFVFSTETEFEPWKPYSKFAAYTLLEHGGDHSAAARALREQGYGDQGEPERLIGLLPPASPGAVDVPPIVGTTALKVEQSGSDIPRAVHATLTDQGNADVMAAMHADTLRWVPSRGQWLIWDQHRWRWCDDTGEATQVALDTLRRVDTANEDVKRHVTRSLSKRSLDAMVSLAARHPALRATEDQLDADRWALNTPGGLIDLRAGTRRAAAPSDLCTRTTHVTPEPGPAPRWHQFLADTFDDPDMADYVQRLAGYSALGAVTHHVLPFLHGGGGNGKTVFLETVTTLLGDYASTAPPSFLMAGRQDESAIARLNGLRMVVCSEVSQSATFDEAKVKLLTGGDQITARFLYGRHFTYTPSATLWLMANHQPRVEAGGESFWRRLRLIPFTRQVPRERRVEGLSDQLVAAEGPQILQWIIDGTRQVIESGMAEPESVMAATRAYAEEEDALARFVADRVHVGGGDAVRVPTAKVRAAYQSWCRSEGESEVSPQVFGRELRTRFGIKATRSNGSRFYVGMTLLADDSDDEQQEWFQ